MKQYLVFEDGTSMPIKVQSLDKNFIGFLNEAKGKITFTCKEDGRCYDTDIDSNLVSVKMPLHQPLVVKLVVDQLPIDYHVYDLKTTIV